MKNFPIQIVTGCDPVISAAIKRLQERWRPYSRLSRRHPLARLLGEIIDPALSEYSEKLPRHYRPYILGAGEERGLSKIIKTMTVGADRAQRIRIRQFEKTARDPAFVATLETLVELLWACTRKRVRHVPVRGLNGHRPAHEFCRFCGKPSEFASFAGDSNSLEIYPQSSGDRQITLRLSNTHCHDHRARLPTGEWNPAYKTASLSVAQFDLELDRLTRQSTNYGMPSAKSGDSLIDEYIYRYAHRFGFRPGDEAEMRNHARWIVDAKVSDQKKRILALQQWGLNQSEIAAILEISRQAVSKNIASIPEIFRAISTDVKHHQNLREEFRTKISDIEPRILDWLDDPSVIDIMLNPDGKLWITRRNQPNAEGGTIITTSQAELIIATIAAETQITADDDPLLECELPGLLRFSAGLPPVVAKPTFAIRKMTR
ncbi:MAG: LuxR family transcriptional regulator [Billgrantia sp.]